MHVLELVKYWRHQNEQDGEMHDRGRGETRFSERREHSTAKSDFSRKPDNPDFYVQVLETTATNASC